MLIEQGNIYSRLVLGNDEERVWLRDYLSFASPDARWTGKDTFCLLHPISRVFMSGFVPLILQAAARDDIMVNVLDKRVAPCAFDPAAPISWLRDYQRAALDRIVDRKRGILSHPTGCLVGDTRVYINRSGEGKPIALKELVARMRGEKRGWDPSIPTRVQSVDADGFVRLNELVAAHDNGEAEIFELALEDGRLIRGTADHKFKTPNGWSRLGDLKVGDTVMRVEWPKSLTSTLAKKPIYRLVSHMWNHPFVQITHSARDGHIARVPFHRLVAEAAVNKITLAELIGRIHLNALTGLTFFDPKTHHVHHKDENVQNNDPSNLEVLPAREHLREHGLRSGWQHVAARSVPARVLSIEPAGRERVYDLTMANPLNNYVANEFVVHNSGKGSLAVALMWALPCRWLFLVHRTGLVMQTADRYESLALEHGAGLPPVGRIGEGKWSVGEKDTFATFQTIYEGLQARDPRVLALLKSAQAVAVDEVHTAPSKTFLKVLCSTPGAYYRVGYSGTPLARGDRKSIYSLGAVGPIVHEIRAEELQKRGVLAKAEIRFATCHQTHASKNWQTVYSALVTRSVRRNALIVALAVRAEKPALVFVRETAHGRILEKELWRAGVRCAFVYGDHSGDQRKSTAKQLKSGALDAIVVSVVWQEGEDFPFLRSVINAGGGESVIGTLQRLGRGMRVEKNAGGEVIKNTFEAYDVLDIGQSWLARHAEARKTACLEQGFSTIVEE